MPLTLNTDQQELPLTGGDYVVSTFLEGGTASLEVKQLDSSNWAPVGELTETPQELRLPRTCEIRLTKTGSAFVEISR